MATERLRKIFGIGKKQISDKSGEDIENPDLNEEPVTVEKYGSVRNDISS